MTFQILEKGQAIKLSQFDEEYCKFHNQSVHRLFYAPWFRLLEDAFVCYGDIADRCKGSRIYETTVKDYRKLNCNQLCQALLLSIAKQARTSTIEDLTDDIESVMKFIEFLKFYRVYEFTFHF